MTVYQAHKDLALALGDEISFPGASVPVVIPDGTRFLTEHRNQALYRAMLTLLRTLIKNVSTYEKKVASSIMLRMLPSLQKTLVLNCDVQSSSGYYQVYDVVFDTDNKPIYVFSVLENISTVPIPIKDHITSLGLLNKRISERSDAFATLYQGLDDTDICTMKIWIPQSRIDPGTYELSPISVNVHYLRYPLNPKDQLSTDTIEIELMWYNNIITLAQTYCMIDSQEMENVIPLLQTEISNLLGAQNAN